MYRIWKALTLGAVIAVAMGASSAAQADSPANNNVCWGQGIKAFAQQGDTGLGGHASAQSNVTPDPGDGGRRGVGNVSKEDFAPLSEGGQGIHAVTVGQFLPEPFECTSPGNSDKVTIEPVG